GYSILPPLRLHSDLNFLRSLPCKPLALAWSEQAFEIAFLSVAAAAAAGSAAGGGFCAKAALAPISEKTIAATTVDLVNIFFSPQCGMSQVRIARVEIYQACTRSSSPIGAYHPAMPWRQHGAGFALPASPRGTATTTSEHRQKYENSCAFDLL